MKLAFSKPTANAAEQRTLFEGLHAAGYDGLQLKAGQYAGYLDDPARFLAEWGEAPGAASALIFGGRLDPPGAEALRRVFRFAGAVGSERVVFCLGVPRAGLTEDDIRAFARTLSALGREALDHGTRLSLHHHYQQPVMHREDFGVFFDAVSDGAVGLTLDTAHLAKSGIADLAGVIRECAPVIDNFHLKDFAAGEFRVLGEGDLDFAPVFAAIRDIGYDGWISADEESGSELVGAMAACAAFLRAGLGMGR